MAFTAAFAAAVGSGATQPAGAKALLKFLTSPEAQAVFKAKGFNPV
jgi:ABC-type molybdate transport system substrate-binding protein